MRKSKYYDIETAQRLLRYDPDQGLLFWKARPISDFPTKSAWAAWSARFVGKVAGTTGPGGYLQVNCAALGGSCRASRLMWAIHTGEQPPEAIDHIDGNRQNNKWSNLRAASFCANNRNRLNPHTPASGHSNIARRKDTGKWRVTFHIGNGKRRSKSFATVEDAIEWRDKAMRAHGYAARHGGFADA